MVSEASRKKAEELCRKAGCDCGGTGNIGREVTGYGHVCGGDDRLCQTSCPVPVQDVDYSECERFHDFAAALDEARVEGAKINEAVLAGIISGTRAEALKEGAERERWECHQIASDFADRFGGTAGAVAIRIAARGPMRGPEEGE